MKNYLVIFWCLWAFQLHSDEQTAPLSLAALEGEPSSIVHGCVSVITGDYVESHTDLVIPGAEPLSIQRFYSSNPLTDRSLGNGWSMNHHGYLDVNYIPPIVLEVPPSVHYPQGRTFDGGGNFTKALMTEENGSSMLFECNKCVSKTAIMEVDGKALERGVTNCARGVISGKTNWKNTTINYYEHNFHATTGTGAHYIFDRKKKDSAQKDIHRLLSIKKPNGAQLSYEYAKHALTDIFVKNRAAEVISSAKIERVESKRQELVRVICPNGNKVEYTFFDKKLSGNARLQVTGSHVPEQWYTYTSEGKHSKIKRKDLPNDRFLLIDYFAKGHNHSAIEIKSSKDLRLNRVKTLQEPVGKDATPITTCKLIYETGDKGKGSKKALEGHTKVYDALNHQAIYYYNDEHRLMHVDKFKGHKDYTLYSRERLFWGAKNSVNMTRLLSRTLEDGRGHLYFNRYFKYDPQGNIVQDILSGNISGTHPQSVVIDQAGAPSKTQNECLIKHYTYSNDGLNLMLKETDGFSTVEYVYHPGTDLLAAQFLLENGTIRKRNFYTYDSQGALSGQVEDDGPTRRREDIQGVSQRKITTILNTPKGLPKEIEEKYLDLATHQERLLHKTVNSYTVDGNLECQFHYDANLALAYQLTWKYQKGQVISQTNALGEQTVFAYDGNGNKCYEQGPNKSYWTNYTYDHANRLIREEIGCADGSRFAKLFTYDYLNRLASTTDIDGHTTTYQYDEFGRLTDTLYPRFADEGGQPIQLKVTKKYDLMGNVIEHTDACGASTKTAYTIQNKPYHIEYADGTVEKNEYGIRGNLVKAVAKNGTYTHCHYDYQSRPLTTTTYDVNGVKLHATSCTYNAFHLLSESDPNGNFTRYSYDGAGRLAKTVKNNQSTTYVYDTLGRLTETHAHEGNTAIINIKVYDLLDRVIEERTEDQDSRVFSKVEYQYDLDGNQISTLRHTEAGVQLTTTRYNVHKEPIEIIDPLNHKIIHVLDTALDCLGHAVSKRTTTDPAGNLTITIKDAMDHIVSVECKNALGQTIQSHQNYYNAQGRKVKQVERVLTPGQESREVITRWEYDLLGQVTDLIEAAGTPEQKHTAYTYALNQLDTLVKPDGCAIHYRYEAQGRLSEQFDSDGSFHYSFSYDQNGNPLCVKDLIHNTATQKVYQQGQVIQETLGNHLTLNYRYDDLGRLILLMLPDNSTIAHTYDPYHLKTVERKDAQNRSLYTHTYEAYDQLGGVLKATLIGQAGLLTQERDLLSRVVSIQASSWKESIGSYDVHGNPLSKTICQAQGTETTEYTYDDLQQLQTEKEHTYLCDSLYNRVAKNGREHRLNALNQLLTDGQTTYEYDPCGRLVKKITESCCIDYTYDALDRLICLKEGDKQTRYRYDSDHRRLSKTHEIFTQGQWVEQDTLRYLYQGQNEIGACNLEGELIELRALGFGQGAEMGAAIAIECGGRIFAPIHDHNGSVVSLIDPETGEHRFTHKFLLTKN